MERLLRIAAEFAKSLGVGKDKLELPKVELSEQTIEVRKQYDNARKLRRSVKIKKIMNALLMKHY